VEHVVFFPAPDGAPAFRRVPSLDEAVRLVEHLRNVEGVSSVSVHALTEVPLAFRAYYKVEVPAEVAGPVQVPAQPAAEVAPVEAVEAPAEPLVDVQDAPVEDAPAPGPVLASSNGHGPAGPASLGFFA
jgi:hypothetical protein